MTQNNNISTTVFADATVDTAFKRIFGTEQFKDATIGLLNSFIDGHHIVDVTFLNPELIPEAQESRKSIIDILCTDQDGAHFIVEMQKAKQDNFLQRAFFYSSKLVATNQGVPGKWNYSLNPTFVLSLLNFNLDRITLDGRLKGRDILHFTTTETSCGAQLPQSTEFVFASIRKGGENINELTDNKKIWLSLLGSSKELHDIPAPLKEDKAFQAYFEGSRMAGFSKEQMDQYTKDMMNDWDIANAKEFARRVGYEDGFAEGKAAGEAAGRAAGEAAGKAAGKAEGLAEGLEKVARTMKQAGVPVEEIMKYTGLSKEQIEAL